MNSFTVQFLH